MDTISQSAEPGSASTIECPFCAEQINARAKKCRFCGETIDVTLRRAEEALRASERHSGNVYMNAAVAATPMAPRHSRIAAALLAILLGGIGAHKFYLGRGGQGILYLIFCWTFIPGLIALVEGIVYACSNDESFHAKYG